MALILTKASVIFLRADASILDTVERCTRILLAISFCSKPSKSKSRIASNSSRLKVTPFNLLKVLHCGRKQRSRGVHFIQRVFLGRKVYSFRYAHMCITILSQNLNLSMG